jgi:glycosyltransferase involved in cell wall biosynthesis
MNSSPITSTSSTTHRPAAALAPVHELQLTSSLAAPRPYFATEWSAPLARRRLLLLSYHFAPSGATGALRWQKFARVLAEQGWGLDVVAVDPSELAHVEVERYQDLPPGLRAYGVREERILAERTIEGMWHMVRRLGSGGQARPSSPVPAVSPPSRPRPSSFVREEIDWSLLHRDGWRRAYFAWIEFARERAWARRAAEVAGSVVEPGVHRCVVTCGPGHLVHEAGQAVAAAAELPLVLDMRDPWSLQRRVPEHLASPLHFHLAATAERRVVDQASLIVMNTPLAAESMARAYPGKRVISVLNGFDEEPLPPIPARTRFVVGFAGTIYLDRDPRLLFRAAARVVRELALTPAEFGLEFIGDAASYGGVTLEDLAAREGIDGFVRSGPTRPRREAMAFLAEASVLLSLPQDSALSVPSKIFEYLRFPASLLALAEPGSATAQLLAGTGVDVVEPSDVEGMAAVLRRCFQAFAAGERPSPPLRDAALSRRSQAARLLAALENLDE